MATNAVAVFNPAAARPSFAVKGVVSDVTKALMGSGGGGKRISIKGGVFRLMNAGKEVTSIDERYLDVVIVNAAAKIARTFYTGKFVEGDNAAPSCWSANGDTPDSSVVNKPAASCATCPNNVKGSGEGDSRACRFSQRIAVVLANDVEGDVLEMTLPGMSVFGKAEGDNRPLQEYARYHAAQGNDISMMITRVRFDTAAAVPKLFFKAMRWLDDEEYAVTSVAGQSPEALAAITMTVSQNSAPAAPAPAALPGPKPKAIAAPVPAPEEEEEAPAPKPKVKAKPAAMPDDEAPAPKPKAKAKPAPAPDDEEPVAPVVRKAATPVVAPAADLAGVLAAWDDE